VKCANVVSGMDGVMSLLQVRITLWQATPAEQGGSDDHV
jgi:hypothetical protein